MRRNRPNEVPPVDTDLDLVETFSETGLEWGGSPEGGTTSAPISARNRTESDVAAFSENMSIEDALAPYTVPPHFQMASTPDSLASSNFSSAFSLPTPGSSVANSAMGKYSVESMASSEMVYKEIEEYHRGIADSPIQMDELETAIAKGDWATIVRAAHQNMAAASDTSSVQSSISFREDWSARSKEWHRKMDMAKAVELDMLVQEGDWEGILSLAQEKNETHNNKKKISSRTKKV